MVRAAILNFSDRAKRQQHRRALGTLQTNLVKRITVDRYNQHFNVFVAYLQEVYGKWPVSAPEYDQIVAEYLEVLWDSGEPKTSATYTLAALHYFLPQVKRQLPRSWKLKATWDKLELPCQAIPLSLEVLFGFAGHFFSVGEKAMSYGCLLGFNTLLRTGELLSLRAGDCVPTPHGFVLHLQDTKGAHRKMLQEETVIVLDALTIRILRLLLQGKLPGDFLVGLSPQQFRTKWNKMKSCLDLCSYRYLPYSLRRGGATWFFAMSGSFSQTMIRGRWQHLKTCKLYISDSQLALSQVSLPRATQTRLFQLSNSFRPQLERWATQGRVEASHLPDGFEARWFSS